MTRQQKMKLALLDCMEFFKGELWLGILTERLEQSYTELRDKCYQALGEPTVLDCQKIREFGEKQ